MKTENYCIQKSNLYSNLSLRRKCQSSAILSPRFSLPAYIQFALIIEREREGGSVCYFRDRKLGINVRTWILNIEQDNVVHRTVIIGDITVDPTVRTGWNLKAFFISNFFLHFPRNWHGRLVPRVKWDTDCMLFKKFLSDWQWPNY